MVWGLSVAPRQSVFNIRKGLDSNACTKQEEEKKIQKKEEERRKIIEKPDLVTSVCNSSSKEAEAGG